MKTPQTVHLKDYRPADFIIDQVDLTFDIHENRTMVFSKLFMRKSPAAGDIHPPLVLDKGRFEISSVIADSMVLVPGEYETGDAFFRLAATPDTFTLEIVSILRPHENTSLEGLYRSGNILCTQCEAQGFRNITPFLDRPDVMAPYSCTIIADKTRYPVLLSNGNLVDAGVLTNNRHFVRWEDPFKKPSYLFALVAGDLAHIHDTFITCSGRQVDLKIYCEKRNVDKCGHAMASLKQAMAWDEQRFGLEYDLDLYQIVAINDFNAGAMENKGLNIFNSRYVLADPDTAEDEDFQNIQMVIGHEYFHNWTGNRVTLKNWFQLSLKEGLTVFRDQEFFSDMNSRGVKRIAVVRKLRGFQFPEDAGPMAHPVQPASYIKMDNFYTMTVYEKGAELVRMIHLLLGEAGFRKGLDLYFAVFDGKAVTIEDFLSVMSQASGKNLDQFLLWYAQSGTPQVTISRSYDAKARQLTLTCEQHTAPDRNQDKKQPLHIPVCLGIIDSRGKNLLLGGSVVKELTGKKQRFVFDNIPENSIPSVFRQFSAPVKINTDLTHEELAFLMAHDTDACNRWDAAQTLFVDEVRQLVHKEQAGKRFSVSKNLLQAFGTALEKHDTDRAFLAKMLCLPLETELKNHFDPVDVAAIHKARSYLRFRIAKQLKGQFLAAADACAGADPKDISADAMADRALKNLCLSYLGHLQEKQTTDLVLDHYTGARNMTDEMAAFKILADIDPDTKKQAVELFYLKWQHDPLVLDKWFVVQAQSELPDTLYRVKELVEHPRFSMKNPNKVRSLIYGFAMLNHVNFHAHTGEGYAFVADRIIALDPVNHAVAARLATCFNQWRIYEEPCRSLMHKALERILGVEGLSG
ncbi:MAG: aminopeptidase N, partial [Desulfotignum sp.]|nr:aminopeptidase N [Desulfotignum sp.]